MHSAPTSLSRCVYLSGRVNPWPELHGLGPSGRPLFRDVAFRYELHPRAIVQVRSAFSEGSNHGNGYCFTIDTPSIFWVIKDFRILKSCSLQQLWEAIGCVGKR